MNPPRLALTSTSAATDGGYTAIHDVGAFLDPDNHRLIGGIAVMLHQYRLGLDHPIRATSDADFGIPPCLLKDDSLIDRIASLGYEKIAGNRWQRKIDATRTATVDLLVPSYVTRQKSNGSTVPLAPPRSAGSPSLSSGRPFASPPKSDAPTTRPSL